MKWKPTWIVRFGAIIGSLLLLYLATRLLFLTKLPIFTDEAIYIRWSQIGAQDANWRFISLTDGKQPLFTWFMMVTLRIFNDPLIAGRMVSVFSGLGTMFFLGLLSYEVFKSKLVTLLTLLFYVLSPFSLMYDRIAIYDSLSAALATANLYLAILLVRTRRLDISLLFGLMLGAGMLNKTSGFIAVYLLPVTLLLFDFKQKNWKKEIGKWVFLACVSFILSQIVYGVLRLSPFYHMIGQKDFVFVHPFKNFYFLYPFFIGNFKGLFEWLTGYLTWPVVILAVGSLWVIRRFEKEKNHYSLFFIVLMIYCFLPLVGLAYFGKVLYPRFILFMTMPLLVLAAYSCGVLLRHFKKQWYAVFLLVFALFQSIWTNYFIITNPMYAPIPSSDRNQLLDDWPAGYGAKESVDFLKKEAEKGKIAVFTEGTFGLFPYALEIYLVENKNITIKGIWPLTEEIPAEIAQSAEQIPTYFILNQTQVIPKNWPLEFIAEYQKGTNQSVKLRLFRVIQPLAYFQ